MTPEGIKAFVLDAAGIPAAGTPMVVYHGTKSTFTEFKTSAWVAEMQTLGHDGVIFVDEDTLETEFCVLNPGQMRIVDNTHRPYLEAALVEPTARS